jgi:hypothetical protein
MGAGDMSDLPPGFVLEGQPQATSDLPPGFVLAGQTPQPVAPPAYSGKILPMSRDAQGNVSFDSNAGIVGMVKRAITGAGSAVTLPGDVYTGKTSVIGPDGHTNPEVINRSLELAGLATPVNPAIRAGDRAIPGVAKALTREKPIVPTTEELAAAGKADITAARNSGLEVTSDSLANWSRQAQQDLFEKGIHPVDAPATYAKLKELEAAPAGSFVTASNLQSLRESLGHTAQNFNPNAAKDQLAASRSIGGLDKFLPSIDSESVVAGAPAATAQLFERGRGNYAAAMRSNDITGVLDRANTGIVERAEARAQAANSGRNLDNTLRQKIASLLEKPKEVSGLSDAEIAALNESMGGSRARNTARYIGNVLGGGGGFGQAFTGSLGAGVGAMFGGAPGAVIGAGVPIAAGAGAKSIANMLAKRSVKSVDELLRKRSPLYQERLAASPMEAEKLATRDTIARLLVAAGIAQPRQ